MINPKDFSKHRRKGGHGPVMVNVRLRKVGAKPTKREVLDVMQHILDTGGDVPEGWQFAAIDWRNPKRATLGWQSGTIDDFENFRAVVQSSLRQAGISIVRREG